MSWVWGWMRQPRDVQQMTECLCFVNTVFIQLITTENAVSSSSTKRLCVHRVPSVRVSLFTSFFSGVFQRSPVAFTAEPGLTFLTIFS
jgi:hypothetical protein